MSTPKILARAAELIAAVLALFGGFLEFIAPPEGEARLAVGIASLLALLLFLLIAAAVQIKWLAPRSPLMFAAGAVFAVTAGVVAVFIYLPDRQELTFEHPDDPGGRLIGGTEYTPEARKYSEPPQSLGPVEIVRKFGGKRDKVWSPESTRRAASILTREYVLLVVCVFGAIFCLAEGVVQGLPPGPGGGAAGS
jgi:hypothetical protein